MHLSLKDVPFTCFDFYMAVIREVCKKEYNNGGFRHRSAYVESIIKCLNQNC